jgi:hypothetical protein
MGVLKSVEPRGFLAFAPAFAGKLGGCESADYPKLPARPRTSFVFARLFGSGFAGLVRRRSGSGAACASEKGPTRAPLRWASAGRDCPSARNRDQAMGLRRIRQREQGLRNHCR